MDRFMLKMSMGYAETVEEESTILSRRIQWRKMTRAEDVTRTIRGGIFGAATPSRKRHLHG